MKTLLAAVFLSLLAAGPSHGAEAAVGVQLAQVTGAVSARASSSGEWAAVKDGDMVALGGEVKTYSGASVVLAFSDGNKVKLEPGTTFGVEGATTLATTLRLFSGKLAAWVKRANRADFRVRHAAGVAAVRGTVFAMEGSETGLNISLFEGSLDVVDSFGRPSTLSPGQNATVSAQAGLTGISSLPPDVKAPEEPKVEAPPAPKTDAAAKEPAKETAPEDLPAAETAAETTELPPPSVKQENANTATTVSPSSP